MYAIVYPESLLFGCFGAVLGFSGLGNPNKVKRYVRTWNEDPFLELKLEPPRMSRNVYGCAGSDTPRLGTQRGGALWHG